MKQSIPTQAYVPPGGHRLPPLPYPYNALEPIISDMDNSAIIFISW
jgi:Fe-Mn family superoxide dismutase